MKRITFRRVAEITLGPLVITRRIPKNHGGGKLYVSAGAGGLRYLLKSSASWDPELLRIADRLVQPGNNVWDVGANVGLFSMAAAFHAGRGGNILAVEPDLNAMRLLERTFSRTPVSHAKVTPLPIAISETVGFVRFEIAKRARAANAIAGFGSTQTGGVLKSRTLPSFSIDHLLDYFPTPDVLKIDIEGAELTALKGAHNLLKKVRPRIYIEVARKNREQMTQLLKECNYRVWDGAEFENPASRETPMCKLNTVAIPEDKVSTFHG